MFALLKCLVFSCTVSAIFAFLSVRDDAPWFKKVATGALNGIKDISCTDTSTEPAVEGECMSKVQCGKSGGKIGNICSLLGVCCVMEKTCSQTTSSKLSYFVPPKKFQTECALNINVINKDVCQIRLDFDKFDIASPTSKNRKENNITYQTSFQCYDDSFEVDKKLGFHHLCGRNTGQHIYIPVGANKKIVIRFNFKDRVRNPHLGTPDWRIKIRQLECQRSGYDLLNAPTKLMSMYNTLKNKKTPNSEWYWIAPPNCLQYYPNKTGVFESFNYDSGAGNYLGGLNYAICFGKESDICGIKYVNEDVFQMNFNNGSSDEDMCHPLKHPTSPTISQDFIRIPGGQLSENHHKDYYCNPYTDITENTTIVAITNEPLYVGVHTDHYVANYDESHQEIGFRLRYETLHGNCFDVPF